MASVINSARQSTSSIFDLVGSTADAAGKVVHSAARAADALDLKAREMHDSVRTRTLINMTVSRDRELMLAAREYVDLLEENYRYVTGLNDFDRAAETNKVIAKMQASLDEEPQV